MTMFATPFSNNYRTIQGGTTAIVYNDDSVLYCDTSTGAITINLGEIPQNQWNTIWKLYVVDSGNNASVNNITIVAGSGQTINDQSTLVLSTNSTSVVIQISGNGKFVSSTSTTPTPASGYNRVQDEGVDLTQRTTINFTGDGVTASDNGSVTIVNIPYKPKGIWLTSPLVAQAIPKNTTSNDFTEANSTKFIGLTTNYNDDTSMFVYNAGTGVLTINGGGIFNFQANLHIGSATFTDEWSGNGFMTFSIHNDGTSADNLAIDTQMVGLYNSLNTLDYIPSTYGTITQLTSITTPVTINTTSGTITLFSNRYYASTTFTLRVNNSSVVDTDTIAISIKSESGGATDIVAQVSEVGTGYFNLSLTAISTSITNVVEINFNILKQGGNITLAPAPRFIDLNANYNGFKIANSSSYSCSLLAFNRTNRDILANGTTYYHSISFSVQKVGDV